MRCAAAPPPADHTRSYLFAETDDGDITYFVAHQLEVIDRAIGSLRDYLARKVAETREITEILHGSVHLNDRQFAIVQHALRDADERFTINSHRRAHRIAYESARSDLLGLESMGLFDKIRVGKKFVFVARSDFTDRLRDLGRTSVDP